MATFNKFDCFAQDLGEGVHDLANDTLRVYLTNTAPNASSHSVKGDLAAASGSGSGYSETGYDIQNSWSGGVLGATDVIIDNADVTFRYVVLYNDTPTSPADPLIGWWDYGSEVNLDPESDVFTVDFGASVFTIA